MGEAIIQQRFNYRWIGIGHSLVFCINAKFSTTLFKSIPGFPMYRLVPRQNARTDPIVICKNAFTKSYHLGH
jgi:hypothetical protein